MDFLLSVCGCNSIALWQICGEKPWFSRQLLTCCFAKKRPLGLLVETLLATAFHLYTSTPFNMGISCVLPAYGLPGPTTEDVTPRRCGISQLIVRTQLIFRPLLGPWSCPSQRLRWCLGEWEMMQYNMYIYYICILNWFNLCLIYGILRNLKEYLIYNKTYIYI